MSVQLWKYFTPFSSVSVVDFEQVNFSWVANFSDPKKSFSNFKFTFGLFTPRCNIYYISKPSFSIKLKKCSTGFSDEHQSTNNEAQYEITILSCDLLQNWSSVFSFDMWWSRQIQSRMLYIENNPCGILWNIYKPILNSIRYHCVVLFTIFSYFGDSKHQAEPITISMSCCKLINLSWQILKLVISLSSWLLLKTIQYLVYP